jgi:hypothetical protein
MNKYRVNSPVTISDGLLKLSDDQFKRRAHALTKTDDGVYAANKPVMFKVGEEFGHDGDLSKVAAVASISEEPEAHELLEAAGLIQSDSDIGPVSIELDADGNAWDGEIHTANKGKTNAGKWKRKPGR